MATLFSSTRWSSEEPEIRLTGEYVIGNRTATTVQVRLKLTVSAVTGSSYYGYNIQAQAKLAGNNVSELITIKGNTPNRWSSPIVKYFPSASGWYTINQAAANTSMAGAFYITSNASGRTATYSGTVKFPIGNTAPVWKFKTSSLSHKGIIPESISNNTFSWGAAYDAQEDTIYYRVKYFVGGKDQGILGSDNRTSRSFSFNPQSYITAGKSMFFRVYCKDSLTSYSSDYLQSETITINTLTAAKIQSISAIGFDTETIQVTCTNGKNSNGVTTGFQYSLTCNACTIYNANGLSSSTSTITIYRTGTVPTGPYIKFSELQLWLAQRGYISNITFTLKTTNHYGTSKTNSMGVSADLRMFPTKPGSPLLTGKYTINSADYWIINRRGITLSWTNSTDPNDAAITYTVQYSLNGGAWADYITTSDTTTTYTSYPITTSQTVKFRIVAKNTYGYTNTSTETEAQTLHYWNPVKITDTTINRDVDSYNVMGTIKENTSMSTSIYALNISLHKMANVESLITSQSQTFDTGTSSYHFSFTVSSVSGDPVSETDTYKLQIRAIDSVQNDVFELEASKEELLLSRYSALLTIREKGIGIHSVAGDFADFISNGTTTLYGGDVHGSADGSVNFSVTKEGILNCYIGCYPDAQGILRSSYTSPANSTHCYHQIQGHFGDDTLVPLRHRWIYPANQLSVLKDAEIIEPTNTPWINFIDESQSSLQSARNQMGLGNTLNALPIVNGGTGATNSETAASLLKVPHLGHLSGNFRIPSNSNLNNYTTPGSYYCNSGADAATLLNCPYTGSHFRFYVISSSETYLLQILLPISTVGTSLYLRSMHSGTWRPWTQCLTTTDSSEFSISRLRLGGSDASLTSTAHGLQIGDTSGANLIFDNNEIISRNNGAVSTLHINGDGSNTSISANGGTVNIGNSTSTINIMGSKYVPVGYKKASISVTSSTSWYVNVSGCTGATTNSAVWATFDRDANDGTIWIKSAKCTANGTIRIWFNVDIALSDTFNISLLWTI